MKEIEFKLVYDGGTATEGLLEIYDAGVSIHGLSRSLAITTHAFLHDGSIRRRAERATGARIYISPPKHGSFEELVKIVLANEAVQTIGYSVVAAAFWDFLKWTWSSAVGREHAPETPFVRRIAERKDPFIGEIAAALESPMTALHRPIKSQSEIKIDVVRTRVGSVITLDQQSLQYVSTKTESDVIENILGNVTKYNILSGFGRFFDDVLDKTVSFDIDPDMSANEKRLLTWSMDQRSQSKEGKLLVDVIRVLNAREELKRYRVMAVRISDEG